MTVRVRFKQGLDAYPKGSSHYLPEDLATHYVRAGVAEIVEHVPPPVVECEPAKSEEGKPEQEKSDEPVKSTPIAKRKRKST